VRILAGEDRGRRFEQPVTRAVRPLSDKVRAAIFDVTGSPQGFLVLDAYAGSGAAGFEALSRRAAMVEAIEANPRVARVVERNLATLDLHWGYLLHVMTVETWLALPGNQPSTVGRPLPRYNLIIADPPYAQLNPGVLARLVPFLLPGGVFVISHSSKRPSPDLPGAQLAKSKLYGDTTLSFYTLAGQA
jgi:16S rRNA (guanine966-N2)-methyltransferase